LDPRQAGLPPARLPTKVLKKIDVVAKIYKKFNMSNCHSEVKSHIELGAIKIRRPKDLKCKPPCESFFVEPYG
jgi:hypothetical protein